jgi:uncharacterized RDD family membrane protein YckC
MVWVQIQSQQSEACFTDLVGRIAIITCETCGTEIQDGAGFCPKCGVSVTVAQIGPVHVPASAQPAESIPAIPPTAVAQLRPVYAGFWLRVLAFSIDNLILGFVFTILIASDPAAFLVNPDLTSMSFKLIPPFTPLGFLVIYSMMWLYFTAFETSAWQATPGKRVFRIYVTDLHTRPPTFSRAAIRNVARMISGLVLVGYFIAGFTEKKQALHDMIAGCLVLRRP